MSVYDYVKILADERKIAISTVEKECGLGNKTIKSWSTSCPKLDKIYPVALFFGVDLGYFLTGVRNPYNPIEKIVLDAFRNTDDEGKARIIQVALNESDRVEKKTTGENTAIVG